MAPLLNNVVDFYDDSILTLVTASPGKVAKWVSMIEYFYVRRIRRLVVGIDVEWRPSYSVNMNPVATLQICVGRRCLIFQMCYCPVDNIPQKLLNFLAGNYTFVGVGVHQDVAKLQRDYGIQVGGKVVDLGVLAAGLYGDNGLKNAGLKGLARLVLGRAIDKPRWITMSNWDLEELSEEQVRYASIDAFASFQIGRVLKAFKG